MNIVEKDLRLIDKQSFLITLCSGMRFFLGLSGNVDLVRHYASSGQLEDRQIVRQFHEHLERTRDLRRDRRHVRDDEVLFVQVDDDTSAGFDCSKRARAKSFRTEHLISH